jgi:hypothetical protein
MTSRYKVKFIEAKLSLRFLISGVAFPIRITSLNPALVGFQKISIRQQLKSSES